jgi:hypothetical protein
VVTSLKDKRSSVSKRQVKSGSNFHELYMDQDVENKLEPSATKQQPGSLKEPYLIKLPQDSDMNAAETANAGEMSARVITETLTNGIPTSKEVVTKEMNKTRAKSAKGGQTLTATKEIEITKVSQVDREKRRERELRNKQLQQVENSEQKINDHPHVKLRFQRNKDTSNRRIVVSAFAICLLYTCLLLGTYLPLPIFIHGLTTMTNFMKEFASAANNLKMAFFTFSETLARQQMVTPGGRRLFENLATSLSQSNSILSEQINSLPNDYSSYNSLLKQFLFEEICLSYLKPQKGVGKNFGVIQTVKEILY